MAQACGHCGQVHEPYLTACPVTGGHLTPSPYVNDDESLVGSVIADRYHLGEVIGKGSTGTVFAATVTHFGRPIALKVLRPRYMPLDAMVSIFHGEARAAWTVMHTSLCEVIDIGSLTDGAPFLVMERLHGETLARRLVRERLSIASAVDVMMQILSVMDAVHEHGLLLHDLRPQNVLLVNRRGCRPLVKILDFGLAGLVPLEKIAGEWDSEQNPADVASVAMPYYLSPERARGDETIDTASDLFVATAIFYEAMTGKRPFTGSSFEELIHRIAHTAPERLIAHRPEAPPDLDALVMRALSSDPRERPPTARDLQDELRSVFDGARHRGGTMPPPPRPLAAPAPTGLPSVDEPYADETRTDQQFRPGDPSATAPTSIEIEIDEDFGTDSLSTLHDEPVTSRGADIDEAIRALRTPTANRALPPVPRSGSSTNEEDETETMELTPELRSRIDQMGRNTGTLPAATGPGAPATKPAAELAAPEPPRRSSK